MAEMFVLGGLLGLIVGGAGRKPEWEAFGKRFGERLGYIAYFQTEIPYGAYKIVGDAAKLSFAEMCYAYLFGLPNSSVAIAAKLLENCLKSKHNEVEGKSPRSMRLVDLIDWAKERLNLTKGEVGDAVRLLRNEVLHEERIVEEPEALQTIKHVSLVLSQLYPFPFVQTFPQCPFCNDLGLLNIEASNAFVGYTLQTACRSCHRSFTFQLMP